MKEGLYALASLDGAPLAPDDLAILHLLDAPGVIRAAGLAVRAVDAQPGAISTVKDTEAVTLLLGFLDEPEELAGTLGFQTARENESAILARAALLRFGTEAPAHMLGEWTLLHWEIHTRRLTLLASEARRDALFFNYQPDRLALAPEMLRLTRLPGVGAQLDPADFALVNSRNGLRHSMADQTIWRGIRQLLPAARETFSAAGRVTRHLAPADPPSLWTGTFEQAVEALDAVGRHILRQTLGRFGTSAVLLSGGLDSSTLTTWAALERGPGRDVFALSSAAPPGSGLPDETEFSIAAARALNMPQKLVWPAPGTSLYLPSAATFAFYESPQVPHRDPTYNALYAAALEGGARAVLDGVFGELSVTMGMELPETRSWARVQASNLKQYLIARRNRGGWPERAFQVRLAPALMQTLPREWAAIWRAGPPRFLETRPDAPLGISAAMRKNAFSPTATHVGLRHLLPYRDRRLLRVSSRMPVRFGLHNGTSRSLARTLLAGRVPDAVRLRTSGMPFAPDYVHEMKAQAVRPLERLDLYREAGVDRWLDLAWLHKALANLQAVQQQDFNALYEVQSTVLAAEFFLWARTQSIHF